MSPIQRIIMVLLPVLWLVGPSHCSLEIIGLATPDNCCLPQTSAEGVPIPVSHACCSLDQIASTGKHVSPRPTIPPATGVYLHALQADVRPCVTLGQSLERIQLLDHGWQFGYGAAAPPRGPSLLV